MNNKENLGQEIQNTATAALSAASKTPFKTAFLLTLGMGLGHLVLFFAGVSGILLLAIIYKLVF